MTLKPPVNPNNPIASIATYTGVAKFTSPSSSSTPATIALWVDQPTNDQALDGTGGGAARRVFVRPSMKNGTNGSRGNSITSDTANTTSDHSSFQGIEIRNTDTGYTMDNNGSFHQTYSALTVSPYSGGGDAYCEAFNHYGSVSGSRKGGLVGNFEFLTQVQAGYPARAAGGRFIVEEYNAIGTYSSANFGVGSSWIATGSRGVEILAQGSGASPCGTGLQIHGAAGYNRAICFNTAGIDAFVVGPTGYVDVTRGTSTANAFRAFVTADTNPRLSFRVDGRIQFGSGSSGEDTFISRQGTTQPTIQLENPATLKSYTTAGRPSAANVTAGSLIYVSDGAGGSNVQCQIGGAWVGIG